MNLIKMLKEDHKKVLMITDKLLQSSQRAIKIREQGFTQLVEELTIHTQFEEQIFYPALKAKTETKGLIFEAYEEHHIVDVVINEMKQLAFNDEKWFAKLAVLNENLKHHIKEEEHSVFVKAKKLLPEKLLSQMAEELSAYKMKAESV